MPSPAISPPATLKCLSSPNVILLLTPAKKTASVFLPLSSPSITSSFLAQGIPALSTFLSNTIFEPFIPPATQSISLTSLLDPAVEFPVQGGNQRQSTSVPASLPSPDLNPLERSVNRPIIESAANLNPDTLHLDFPQDKNIANLLEALAEDACNANENIALSEKKKTLAKDAYHADEDVAMARKKRT